MGKNVRLKNLVRRGSPTTIYILRAVLFLATDLADGEHTSTDAVMRARKDNVNASIFHFSRFLSPPPPAPALMRSIDFYEWIHPVSQWHAGPEVGTRETCSRKHASKKKKTTTSKT